MINRRFTLLVVLAFIYCLSFAQASWAMGNDKFLTFCGTVEEYDYENPSPLIGDILKANPQLNVNYRGPGGRTPLMAAASNSALDFAREERRRSDYLLALVASGADVNLQDENGATALMLALETDPWPSVILSLLTPNTNLQLKNKHGLTALDLAAAKAHSPEVLGLLLIVGESNGINQDDVPRLRKAAQTNPEALAVLNAWASVFPRDEPWKPVFVPMPDDPTLAEDIKNAVQKFKSDLQNLPVEWQLNIANNYLIWHIHLPNTIAALKQLGLSEAAAWREAYAFLQHSLIIEDDGLNADSPNKSPAKLIVHGNYGQDDAAWKPYFVLTKNKILVAARGEGLVGYELSTGKELWRNADGGGLPEIAFGNLVLTLDGVQDDGLAKLAVIDANDGRTIWEDFNTEYWLADPQRQTLTISGGTAVATFNLAKYGQKGWANVHTLRRYEKDGGIEIEEASRYLSEQGINLADFFEIKTERTESEDWLEEWIPIMKRGLVGFPTQNPYTGPPPIRFDIEPGRYVDLANALAKEEFGFNQFSLWTAGDNNQLAIFNRLDGKSSLLSLPLGAGNDGALRLKDLKVIEIKENEYSEEMTNKALASFSQTGNLLGLTDREGNLHFFDGQGAYIGSISGQTAVPGQTSVKTGKAATLKDLNLLSVLDESDPQKPLALFNITGQDNKQIVAHLDLGQGKVIVGPEPAAAETASISAFALSADNLAAVACDDGSLWFIDMHNGKLHRSEIRSETAWVAMAFSDEAQFLALAGKSGQVLVLDRDEKVILSRATKLQDISQLAIDSAGKRVWAAMSGGCLTGVGLAPKLALITENTNPKVVDLAARGISGEGAGLRYDLETDKAFLLIWKLNDFGQPTVETGKKQDVALDDVQAVVAIRSGPLQAENMRFDESVFSPFACAHILGLSAVNNLLVLEGGFEYTQAFNPNYVYNLETDRVYRLIDSYRTSDTSSVGFSDDGRLAALGEDGTRVGSRFFVYDLQTGGLLRKMPDSNKHPFGIKAIAFIHKQPQRLLTAGEDGTLRLWDLSSIEPVNLLTWSFLKNGNHVVAGQDYRFDTPDLDRLEGVHWVVDHLPGRTVALASLMKDYYQPRLAEYVLNNKKLPELPDIGQLNLNQHGVRRVDIKPEPNTPDKVAVTVEIYVRGDDPSHPAQELKLFRDGQLVGKYTGENNGLFDLPDGKRQVTFRNIALPQSKNQVMFKAWAFNGDGVRSKYFDRPYDYKPASKTEPKLHLISMGVNNFDNPAWDLKYAVNDAKGYAEKLPAKLSNIKSDVQLLASGEGLTKPTKGNLKAALQKLAEGGSNPDDVVVLAIASHGLTDDKDNQFYILPADIPGQGKKTTPELLAHSISTEELSDWLTTLDAAEIVMILDTCQSGAALGGDSFKPGPMGDKGLGQLAYDKAMRVLTATNENNAAMELDNLEHGLLSFALVEDGLQEGKVGKGNFTFKDWLVYGQKRTAELYADIASGKNVSATRGKARVDKTVDNANPPLGQEPYLFDFGGQGQVFLMKGGGR